MIKFKCEEELVLKYWKLVSMPEKVKDDKGVFQKTGKNTEMTGYSFHTPVGEELYFISPSSEYRNLEGKQVELYLKGIYDDYGRKNKFALDRVVEIDNL